MKAKVKHTTRNIKSTLRPSVTAKVLAVLLVAFIVFSLVTLSRAMNGKGFLTSTFGTKPSVNKVDIKDKSMTRALLQQKVADLQKQRGGRGGSGGTSAGTGGSSSFVPAQAGKTTCAGGSAGIGAGNWANDGHGTCYKCEISEAGTANSNGRYVTSDSCDAVRLRGEPVVGTPDEVVDQKITDNCYDGAGAIYGPGSAMPGNRVCSYDPNTKKSKPVPSGSAVIIPNPNGPKPITTVADSILTGIPQTVIDNSGLTQRQLTELAACLQWGGSVGECSAPYGVDSIDSFPTGSVDPNSGKYTKPTIVPTSKPGVAGNAPAKPQGSAGVVVGAKPKVTVAPVNYGNNVASNLASAGWVATGGTAIGLMEAGQGVVNVAYNLNPVTLGTKTGAAVAKNVIAPMQQTTGNVVGTSLQVVGTFTGNTDIYDAGTAVKTLGTSVSHLTTSVANTATTIVSAPLTVVNKTINSVQTATASLTTTLANAASFGWDQAGQLWDNLVAGATPPRPSATVAKPTTPKPTSKFGNATAGVSTPNPTPKPTTKPKTTTKPVASTPKPAATSRYDAM